MMCGNWTLSTVCVLCAMCVCVCIYVCVCVCVCMCMCVYVCVRMLTMSYDTIITYNRWVCIYVRVCMYDV